MSSDPVAALVAELAYAFKDIRLLHRALTHRSYVNECAEPAVADNERLEFLGDAVLDLVVSNELMQRLPKAREGELSRVRASMVSEPALAELARNLGLGPALRLGRGEELSGGRDKPSLLSDGFEALVAAMYLDGGMEVATQFVLSRVKMPTPEEIRAFDSKTALQHKVQAEFKIAPRYRLARSEGPDHAKVFYVEITVSEQVVAEGAGSSKKEAEQAAAAAALLRFNDPEFVAEVTIQPAAKSDVESVAKSGANSAAKSGAKLDSKFGANSAVKSGAKSDSKSGAKSGAKSDSKSGANSAAKSGANSAVKPGAKSGAKSGANSAANSAAKSGATSADSGEP